MPTRHSEKSASPETLQGGSATPSRSVVHATFDLERTYDAPVARVWKAFSDASAKAKWFAGSSGKWQVLERQMDVRVGGRELLKGRWQSGLVTTFDAVYHDVIPNERLVYSYQMFMDERKISVSLATLQLEAQGTRTMLKVTEQGASSMAMTMPAHVSAVPPSCSMRSVRRCRAEADPILSSSRSSSDTVILLQ